MKSSITWRIGALLCCIAAGSASANEPAPSSTPATPVIELYIEIPRLAVAEYHRPYVAIWLEQVETGAVTNLAVWYDVAMADHEGAQWLKDLRQWWRRSGRTLTLPLDGLTGATRAPGEHRVRFGGADRPLPELSAGAYRLHVEAAREVGGRELVTLPLQWPADGSREVEAAGQTELGKVRLRVLPRR